MFGLRFTSEVQKRSKNGQPPQSTTGVARKNSIEFRTGGETPRPTDSPNMESSKTGSDNAALIQKRSRMESYSGSASTSAKTSIGSSAIPQIGQVPGPICTTSGCIGHV